MQGLLKSAPKILMVCVHAAQTFIRHELQLVISTVFFVKRNTKAAINFTGEDSLLPGYGGVMRKTETGLYELLESLLKKSDRPQTCVELFDVQEIRDIAASSNRVSDYLGHLWRRGKVTRVPAARNSVNDGSRWAYAWRHGQPEESNVTPIFAVPKTSSAGRMDMQITYDDDSVTIYLPSMTINIKHK
jgi:hypothetical protein